MHHILYSMCLRLTADCEFFTQNVLALEGIWSSLWGLNVKYVEIPIVFDKKRTEKCTSTFRSDESETPRR